MRTLILLILLATTAHAASVTLGCPATMVPLPHQAVVVPIIVDVGQDSLGAYSVDLLYNPADFDVTQVIPGPDPTFLAGFTISFLPTPGELEVAGYQVAAVGAPSGQIAVATVIFTAKRRAKFNVGLVADVLFDTGPVDIPMPLSVDAAVGCDPVRRGYGPPTRP